MMQLGRDAGAMGMNPFAQVCEAWQEAISGNGRLPPGDGAHRPGDA